MLWILGGLFDFDKKKEEYEYYNQLQLEADFWADKDRANSIILKCNHLKDVIEPVSVLEMRIMDNISLLDEVDENSVDLITDLENDYKDCALKLDELKLQTYLSGEYDSCNCLLEIHSGAGGTESCDWANMLYRMYTRYFDKCGYKVEEIDKQPG